MASGQRLQFYDPDETSDGLRGTESLRPDPDTKCAKCKVPAVRWCSNSGCYGRLLCVPCVRAGGCDWPQCSRTYCSACLPAMRVTCERCNKRLCRLHYGSEEHESQCPRESVTPG